MCLQSCNFENDSCNSIWNNETELPMSDIKNMLIKISVLRENTKLKFQLVLLYIQNKTFLINFLKVIETFPP